MLDIKRIREQPDDVRRSLENKGVAPGAVDTVLRLDEQRRQALGEAETLKNQRNTDSKRIGELKKQGADTTDAQAAVRAIGERIAALDTRLREIEGEQEALLLSTPNTPHASVPVGRSEAENVIVRQHGEPRAFSFTPRTHIELGEQLKLMDFKRAARMSGAGFALFTGMGARLQRALIQFMLDVHVRDHGYEELWPPALVNAAAMTGTGQLPKMAEDMYRLAADELYLIPTAEVPVTNFFREEILDRPLPIRLTAYTPCFRREAGAAGKDTRGLVRLHQFDKVEMVKFTTPESSYTELEALVGDAEDILQRLGLVYRVKALCTGDLSFAAAKCYDLELWAPANQVWLEVSSCSNFEDFQARRAGIRYRDEQGKTRFVHTLNGSGVALPRLVVALLENGQQADGSVVLPPALVPYMGGVERLTAPVV